MMRLHWTVSWPSTRPSSQGTAGKAAFSENLGLTQLIDFALTTNSSSSARFQEKAVSCGICDVLVATVVHHTMDSQMLTR